MPCLSTTHIYVVSKTDTTITIAWAPAGDGLYQVEYREEGATTWLLLPTQDTTTQAIIGNLSPDTNYQIRVNTLCNSGSCYSVTLLVPTSAFC